jgi:hypothetical protein
MLLDLSSWYIVVKSPINNETVALFEDITQLYHFNLHSANID